MRLDRSIGLALLLIAPGTGPARAEDSPASAVLKGKGLTKSGRAYVIDAETPVLAKIKEARAAFSAYASLAERQSLADRANTELTRVEERRVELQSNLDDLNQRIAEQASQPAGNFPRPGPGGLSPRPGGPSPSAERDQIKAMLAEATGEQKLLKAQVPQPKDRTVLDENTRKAEEAFRADLASLRPLVDEVTKKYAELGADEAVKKAIDELKKASKAKLNLGPSDAFLAAAKELDMAERRFLGKKAPAASKKKAKSRK